MPRWSNKKIVVAARHWGLVATMLLAMAPLGACYEGWDYDEKGNGNGDGSGSETPPPAGPATFFYILFEPIYFSAAAIADTGGCFASTGIGDFRKNEWDERVAALAAVLKPLAETFVMTPIEIAKDDCTRLSALRSAAINPSPWSPSPTPGDDPLDRSLIHVKAAFFEDDVTGVDPPAVVSDVDWAAWKTLKAAGRKARSVHHFVREHAADGYVKAWSDLIPTGSRKDGTPIDTIDATDDGIAKRTATIKGDATAFAAWLVSQP